LFEGNEGTEECEGHEVNEGIEECEGNEVNEGNEESEGNEGNERRLQVLSHLSLVNQILLLLNRKLL
jgi:hypothetical protein